MSYQINTLLECFRLNRVAFNDLLQKISPLLPGQDVDEAIRSSGSPITNYCRLAMTLRWLAGGHYLDICQLYQVDYTSNNIVNMIDDIVISMIYKDTNNINKLIDVISNER
jgi:hypothetical protein